MRVTVDLSAIERRVQWGHDRAVDDVLAEHRSRVPVRSGEYRESLRRSGSGLTARVGSDLDRAAAMRFGANVGGRKGPHHGPVDRYDDAQAYIERVGEAIRSA